MCRHSACSRLLLDDSANPLLANIRGDTALHLAANRGHASCVDLLLQGWVRGHDGFPVRAASVMVTDASGEGRYIDCHNKSGLAPLHLAVLGGNVETGISFVTLLIISADFCFKYDSYCLLFMCLALWQSEFRKFFFGVIIDQVACIVRLC